jgi:DNA polymerase (family 10)
MTVPGLGPKTAKLLYDQLKISDLESLEKFAKEGKLRELPHIKEKTEENILKGIESLKKGRERMPIGTARPIAEEIVNVLKEKAPVKDIAVAGSIRRWKETVKDIDILVTSDDASVVMDVFVTLPLVRDVIAKGQTKSSVVLSQGIQVDVRVVERAVFGAALVYFTGSKSHNIKIREIAVRNGMKISEYGIFDEKTGKSLGGKKERDIYDVLGMDYIEPELREDNGEVEAALSHSLPRLITLEDMKGDLHVHSNWTDGRHSIAEAAAEAKKRGYEYIAITDHTKGLGVTNGMTGERVLEQIKEIDSLNKKLRGLKVLKGIEVDIRSDGTLDIPDGVLKKLDLVIAAIHSGFKQTRDQLTARIASAMKNPSVTIIAHPTGRLIGEREAYDADMEKLFKIARETGTALEINAYPARLDLNDVHAREAKRLGIPVAISTDMHLSSNFDFLRYGVAVARRGWLEKNNVINTKNFSELKKFLRGKKNRQP